MRPWLLKLVACPRCGARLSDDEGGAVVRCRACGPFPVLGGVPVLVPEPARWCASFHDAALAALAEQGAATKDAVETLRAFADAASAAEPSRFGDDWTRHEAADAAAPEPVPGPAHAQLTAFVRAALEASPRTWLESRVHDGATVADVGCGAGVLSAALARRARRLLLGDLSLRAALLAHRRASGGGAEVAAVVLDADALPLAAGAFDAVAAENVVDLLEGPLAFLQKARAALKAAGRLLLSTPSPHLGAPDADEDVLAQLAQQAGFRVETRDDGLPWLRRNDARHLEVYLVQALELVPVKKRRA